MEVPEYNLFAFTRNKGVPIPISASDDDEILALLLVRRLMTQLPATQCDVEVCVFHDGLTVRGEAIDYLSETKIVLRMDTAVNVAAPEITH